jgi:CO dehydrogenase/acetyl-CoA synthase gamma subunit (corrinoid Fe-S protein)
LYAAGNPDADHPVLVSANFKLSFDLLRRELGGLDAWILVLDTKRGEEDAAGGCCG